jgi:hypothetical protein
MRQPGKKEASGENGKTQLPIENPINSYLLNSPMRLRLKKNPDGSLTI